MGVSIAEVTVVEWKREVGDRVREGEPICDVATDKLDVEVVAPADGIMARILVDEGATVPIGTCIAELQTATEEAAAEPRPAMAVDDPASHPADATPSRHDYAASAEATVPVDVPGGRIMASPAARRAAHERGVDLRGVAGTGLRGRIRVADVLEAPVPAAPAPSPERTVAEEGDGLPAGYHDVPHEIVPTSRRRRLIAEHMVRSRTVAPHMTTEVEVDMSRVAAARAALNERREAQGERRLSFLPFVAAATVQVLQEFPDLNATFAGDRSIRWRTVNLGIAVDTDEGLVVPVVRDAAALSVVGLAERISALAASARAGTLSVDDVRGGTFTISNPGSVGAVSAPAIINQPQVAILGLPAIVKRPVAVTGPGGEDIVAVRPMTLLALTFDHRALDGAEATRAAVAIKGILEAWPT